MTQNRLETFAEDILSIFKRKIFYGALWEKAIYLVVTD